MSNALNEYETGSLARSAGFRASHAEMVNAVIICSNSLIGVGITHLLDGTSFVAPAPFTTAAKATEIRYISPPDLFIIGASATLQDTVEAVSQLRGKFPNGRIVVIADHYDLGFVKLCLDAGVDGFCLMGSSREVLIKSLELILLGELILPAALMISLLDRGGTAAIPKLQDVRPGAQVVPEDPRAHKLSEREAEILGHLMEGAANKIIARKLDLAEATIKVHVKAILRKIGAANRTQAAMWASTHLPASKTLPLSS